MLRSLKHYNITVTDENFFKKWKKDIDSLEKDQKLKKYHAEGGGGLGNGSCKLIQKKPEKPRVKGSSS